MAAKLRVVKNILIYIVGGVSLIAGCSFSTEHLELHEATEVLEEASLRNMGDPDKQIAILPAGTKVVILDHEYGKAYLAYKIETDDGLKGYIMYSPTQMYSKIPR